MDGWELIKPNEDILSGRKSIIRSYVQQNLLAGTDENADVLLIIRKYHSTLNCRPDDPKYRSGDYRMCLAYYNANSYLYFELPGTLTYKRVAVAINR